MSIAGETSPASPGHRAHQGDSIIEKGRRKKSSNRRSSSSNGVRGDAGSVFARESGLFFSMTHLLFPWSCIFLFPFLREPATRSLETLRPSCSPPSPRAPPRVAAPAPDSILPPFRGRQNG